VYRLFGVDTLFEPPHSDSSEAISGVRSAATITVDAIATTIITKKIVFTEN
jgi:hypothetical protein